MESTKLLNFTIEVTRAQLRAALIFSADKDIRYYLNGVCLHVGECGDARLVATDGHRLAIVKLCDESNATPGEYIIPREPLKAIKKAGRFDKPLSLTIEADNFRLNDTADNSILFGSKLIDGKFPEWQRVAILPDFESLTPGAFNAAYLADIQKALKELGSIGGHFHLIQNTERAAVVNEKLGFMCVVMAIREDKPDTSPDITKFMPRTKPAAIIETATGGQAFPCDPLQDVSDKREQQSALVPEVVAHCGAELAAWLDPAGALQKAGLLIVAHIGDNQQSPPATHQTTETASAPDAEYLEYLASMESEALAA